MTTAPTNAPDPIEARLDAVYRALGDVWDPELGIDIVSLGLIYEIRIAGDRVDVDMTLTTPGCPVSEQLPLEAHAALRSALPDAHVTVNVVWDPPWSIENISPIALEKLRLGRRR